MNAIGSFVLEHLVLIKSSLIFVAGYAVKHFFPNLLAKEEAKLEPILNLELAKLSPAEKQLILSADKWLGNLVPEAGSQRYQAAVNILVSKVPQLAPFKAVLLQALIEVGLAAKQILEDEQKPLA